MYSSKLIYQPTAMHDDDGEMMVRVNDVDSIGGKNRLRLPGDNHIITRLRLEFSCFCELSVRSLSSASVLRLYNEKKHLKHVTLDSYHISMILINSIKNICQRFTHSNCFQCCSDFCIANMLFATVVLIHTTLDISNNQK